ncbi:c-type cytochrome [Aestuariibacter halophilus]|uniref:C-type cytochrome n=1 Tax=Fluctibacter halophilus TaxID=226011 RepID=A0ABS8G7Q0_9ALTE|nr:cytochrome c peroxidase [Aestuariibacter halophilus]MCC2616553.1 c-type cytochrome [Aestuariibacter halophilus]
MRFNPTCTFLLLVVAACSRYVGDAQAATFSLPQTCPPSFELRDDGRCYLVSLYQFYDSVQNRGVGGTQTALPAHRDGFTPAQIGLGKWLFFDPLLSGNHQLSCASCHRPDKGLADGRAHSIGVTGKPVKRSAPSLWNVGFLDHLFWDARADSLEQQAAGPLFDPNEMGNTPQQLLSDLANSEIYPALFKAAFPHAESPNLADVMTALAAFQSTLVSLNSRYDQYAHGYHQALSEREIEGLNVFRSFVARCAECHQPPLFTNNQIAVIGVPEAPGQPLDPGAQVPFNAAKLRGGFKVPTLRNVTKTAPYMHAGNFAGLRDAVEFYNKGRGHAVPPEESLQIHWHIWDPQLTDDELDAIVTFLGALDDESLMPPVPVAVPSGLPPVDADYRAPQTHTQTGK